MTLQEFENWALSQGQVGNPTNPPTYVGQCVSLVQQYLDKVYGIPYQARGNAKDWPTNADVLSYFDKVSGLQTGDIIVYGTDYGGGYGHIGVYNGHILDQNGHKSLHVAVGAVFPNPIAILRRKGSTPIGGDVEPLDEDRINRLWLQFLGHAPSRDDINAWTGKKTWDLISAILGGQEWVNYEKKVADALAGGVTPETLKPGVYKVG